MWKHLALSLSMNITDFIFRLFYIRNLLTLYVLTLVHLTYKPSTNYAHLSIDSENIFGDIIGFSIDYAHNSDDCVNTLNDEENIVVDSINMPNISFIDFSIPNPTLLPLLLICGFYI